MRGYVSGWVKKEEEEFQIDIQAFITHVPEKHFTQGEGMVRARTQEEGGQVNFILWKGRKENREWNITSTKLWTWKSIFLGPPQSGFFLGLCSLASECCLYNRIKYKIISSKLLQRKALPKLDPQDRWKIWVFTGWNIKLQWKFQHLEEDSGEERPVE